MNMETYTVELTKGELFAVSLLLSQEIDYRNNEIQEIKKRLESAKRILKETETLQQRINDLKEG